MPPTPHPRQPVHPWVPSKTASSSPWRTRKYRQVEAQQFKHTVMERLATIESQLASIITYLQIPNAGKHVYHQQRQQDHNAEAAPQTTSQWFALDGSHGEPGKWQEYGWHSWARFNDHGKQLQEDKTKEEIGCVVLQSNNKCSKYEKRVFD